MSTIWNPRRKRIRPDRGIQRPDNDAGQLDFFGCGRADVLEGPIRQSGELVAVDTDDRGAVAAEMPTPIGQQIPRIAGVVDPA